jgi:hypothetical protein
MWLITRHCLDGGAAGCLDEEQALVDYVKANRSCLFAEDCVVRHGLCASQPDFCDGSFYMNVRTDEAWWRALASRLRTCNSDAGLPCVSCDALPPPPACIDGICQTQR